MFISIDAEEALAIIQCPLKKKSPNKLETEGNLLKMKKAAYEKPKDNIIQKTESFCPTVKNITRMSTRLPLLLNIGLEGLAREIRLKK